MLRLTCAAAQDLAKKMPDIDFSLPFSSQIAALLRTGQLEKAQSMCIVRSEQFPDDAEAWQWLGCIAMACGDDQRAVDCLERAFRLAPEQGHIQSNYLESLCRTGRLDKAREILARVSVLGAAEKTVLVFRARIAQKTGDWREAAEAWQALLERDAENPDYRLAWAEALVASGDWQRAADVWRQLLPCFPERRGEILCNLGNSLLNAGQIRDGLMFLQEAVQQTPSLAPAWFNLGRAWMQAGETDAGLAAYARALALAPDALEIAATWGEALLTQGDSGFPANLLHALEHLARRHAAAALLLARRASQMNDGAAARRWWRAVPALSVCSAEQAAEAWINLGQQALNEKDLHEARRCLDAALQRSPGSPLAWYNLGLCHHLADDYVRARAAYQDSLAGIEGEVAWRPALLGNLARACFDLGEFTAARRYLEIAGAAQSDRYQLFGNYVDVLMRLADWEMLGKVIASGDWPEKVNPFTALALADDPHAHWRAARGYARTALSEAAAWSSGRVIPSGRRLRVGYLSSDLHAHATAFLIVDVLACHDRQRVEVFAYSYGPEDGSGVRQRVREAVEHFRDVAGARPRDIAAAIRRDRIDILVDLKGYTHRAMPEVLSGRPAPIQVNWLGFPGVMATPALDYIIVDRFICPDENSAFPMVDRKNMESPVRLSRCYQPGDRWQHVGAAGVRLAWGLPETGFVFASFNQIYKITGEVFEVWCRIVSACPRSVLWLFDPGAEARNALLEVWKRHELSPERLVWAPVCEHERHLARLTHADLLLDSFPYGAHTTASDALRQGVLVLTRVGISFPSRVAGSLLWHLGLSELICRDWASYEALACRLHADSAMRSELRERLRNALHGLLDAPGFASELEAAYLAMAERHRQGMPPSPMSAGMDFPVTG